VQRAGVPDIGGQPVDVAYDTYRDMYSLYGSLYPRDNRTPGWNGYDYGGTEVYRYFRLRFPATPRVAAVVYYNQAASQRFATSIIAGLRAEGYRTYGEQVDFALPDFNSVVLDMKRRHVRYVYDTLDSGGNQGLCAAIDQNQMPIQAKVTTEESWRDDIGRTYQQSTRCRAALFAYGYADNYDDLSNPAVAQFRAAVHSYHLDARNRLSEWELDGWAAAQWLTDAMQSCGAALTRRCVLHFMDAIPAGGYDGHGLLSPVGTYFPRLPNPPKTARTCVGVARWEDSAIAGQGGWVTQPVVGNRPDRGFSCFVVPLLPYPAT
jgi:branched-chain amino acid transport system substrate-binding protein